MITFLPSSSLIGVITNRGNCPQWTCLDYKPITELSVKPGENRAGLLPITDRQSLPVGYTIPVLCTNRADFHAQNPCPIVTAIGFSLVARIGSLVRSASAPVLGAR